ncbi:hypothetical protein [Kribbella sp. VKM Ac-2568]|uniref:hypothetical protein n=1 Tax=Kribbella sp. VKM Ac-2568 TaxID=2512219 RepID=UPI00104DC573|nr:hypothetical protein [Kribbella sp. VKM Ac-2568]TCM48817.1 hypothetical protein EV648_10381 [Kribbella sp. VKM Ac-2568]
MTSYAARAVPWGLLGTGAGLMVGLLLLVEYRPYTLWPLQGTAVGLLAGMAVWCYQEPAAVLVDTLPRGLAWRTTARSAGAVGLLAIWLVAVKETRTGYFGHTADVAWQGVAAMIAATGFMTWRRSRGSTGPAAAASAGIVAVALFIALARPFAEQIPLFPYTADDDWTTSRILWTGLGLAGVGIPLLLRANRPAPPRSTGA